MLSDTPTTLNTKKSKLNHVTTPYCILSRLNISLQTQILNIGILETEVHLFNNTIRRERRIPQEDLCVSYGLHIIWHENSWILFLPNFNCNHFQFRFLACFLCDSVREELCFLHVSPCKTFTKYTVGSDLPFKVCKHSLIFLQYPFLEQEASCQQAFNFCLKTASASCS